MTVRSNGLGQGAATVTAQKTVPVLTVELRDTNHQEQQRGREDTLQVRVVQGRRGKLRHATVVANVPELRQPEP